MGSLVAKIHVHNKSTSNSFDMFSFTVNIAEGTTSAFFAEMPEFPHFKKFSAPGMYDYAFFDLGEDDFGSYMTVTLFAFKREITAFDFAAALSAFAEGDAASEAGFEALLERASEEIGFPVNEPPSNYFGLSEELILDPAESSKQDVPHLQKLVHAIISLHLQGVGIDVFRSTESDDFMVFPNYLSYLWYRFSRQLGQVKIGYCEICGRGFSLAGHRGISRTYCSEQCKTKAKNARVKRQRDVCRELFIEQQLPVSEVAKTVYAEELSSSVRANKRKTPEEAENQVRKNLVATPHSSTKWMTTCVPAPVRHLCDAAWKKGCFLPSRLRSVSTNWALCRRNSTLVLAVVLPRASESGELQVPQLLLSGDKPVWRWKRLDYSAAPIKRCLA